MTIEEEAAKKAAEALGIIARSGRGAWRILFAELHKLPVSDQCEVENWMGDFEAIADNEEEDDEDDDEVLEALQAEYPDPAEAGEEE